jgi:hypothetical protein
VQKPGIITARLADGAVRRSHHRIGQHPEQVSQLHRQFVYVGSDVVGTFTYYHPSGIPFPTVLDSPICNRYEIVDFAREAYDLGVSYFGVCCGSAPHQIRSMAEALGQPLLRGYVQTRLPRLRYLPQNTVRGVQERTLILSYTADLMKNRH